MASEWQTAKLGDLVSIIHGYAFSGEYFRDEPPGDYLLTPGNFAIGGGFKFEKPKYYLGPVPKDYVLSEGDLLITMTDLSKSADTLGYPALVPASTGTRFLHNQRLGRVVVKPDAPITLHFLYYLLQGKEYRNEIIAGATGTTVKHTSPNRISAYRFPLPPLPEQRAIAAILSGFDDKIELNRRMNATLEAAARALFKSWFVDFDPVRAKMEGRQPEGMDAATAALFPDRLVESALGEIPAGWRVGTLGESIEINPTRRLAKGEVVPYLAMENMPTHLARATNWTYREVGSGAHFVNGDVLLARITPCLENGKTAYVDFLDEGQVGWGSTEYIVFRSKSDLPLEYPYFLLRTEELREFAIRNMSGTSGRQRVNGTAFSQYMLVIPANEIAHTFGNFAQEVFLKMKANDEESRTLAAARDALLPKLVSGEIRII